MDTFLLQSQQERYGDITPLNPISLVSSLVNSKAVTQLSEIQVRKIAYLVFSYLIQLELSSVSSGFSNKILYTESYKLSDWSSPTFKLRDGVISQYQIVCSRIAFEIFIDLLYTIETGNRLISKKSKLKTFRKWLQDVDNNFHYFAHVLLIAYKFDREIRTPEVHGSSSLPRRLLLLQEPSFEESNQQFRLTNTLMNVWRPLIDILNNIRPTYMHITETDEEWFQTYMSGDDAAIEVKLSEMLAGETI